MWGVDPRRGPPEVAQCDIPREDPVQRFYQLVRREAPGVGERDHLPRGVHPGVRSAGSVDSSPSPTAEAGERVLEGPPDCPGTRLDLGPGAIRAAVFNRRAVTRRRTLPAAVFGRR